MKGVEAEGVVGGHRGGGRVALRRLHVRVAGPIVAASLTEGLRARIELLI
jgi:hypothetical protein